MLDIIAICLVITALLAYLNYRFVGLPTAIGVMATALGLSLVIVGLNALGVAHNVFVAEEKLLRSIDFSDVLLEGMLSLLLFAWAPVEVWSLHANMLTGPLVALVFLVELLVRRRVLPAQQRPPLREMIRSWRLHSAGGPHDASRP